MFGSPQINVQQGFELWDMFVCQLDVPCSSALPPLVPQFYPHGPCDVLCLPVCCVWVSGSQWPWQFCLSDQTLPRCDFHNTEPKQTGGPRRLLDRVSVTTGLFTDSLHYNTFQNMPTAVLSLPKPFRLLFGSVNIPLQHISTYVQHHISRTGQECVCGTEEQL